jgi:SAM-dependent methyltransferase
MKPRLVEHLACPDCAADLRLSRERSEAGEVIDGELRCTGCAREFPIVRGVPRLLPRALADLPAEVADGFGWEWNRFDEIRPEYEQQLLDWVRPLGPGDFAGKRVLEGGCGKGRHSRLVASWGARDVFAVDLGSAVEAAFRNCGREPAVHVIQGDIAHLPLKRVADVAFSVGVLHHMPQPEVGFRALVDRVVPGGQVAVWVYGREGNEWIVQLVDPVRTHVTSRLPRALLYHATRPLGWLIAGVSKGIYGPLAARAPSLHGHLAYRDYLTYIARLPAREIHSIVFDQLVTPVAHYLSRGEVEAWFEDPRLESVAVEPHNANSWRARARLGGAA